MLNQDVKLGVIGCGKMASAILGGVIKNNFLNPSNIFIYDVNSDASIKLSEKFNFNAVFSIDEISKNSNVLLLATKPFVFLDVMNELKKYYNNQLVLSILAGIKIEKYLSVINDIKIARIMPNTPALVNEAMSAVCSNDKKSLEFAYNFMSNCGRVIKTTEDKMDVITALSGSGPAFYFKIIALLAKSASKLGLSNDEALMLSAQTALGSAKMIFENDFKVDELIKNVTTPGGCTAVGNDVLNNSDIDKIFDKTIKDTMQKAIELGS